MENNCSLVAALAVLFFLSSPSTWSGHRVQGQGQIVNPTFEKFFKNLEDVIEICKTADDAENILDNLSELFDNADEPSRPTVVPAGFYITFQVGSSQRAVQALMSISSTITWFNNYLPTPSSTNNKCCFTNGNCFATNPYLDKCNGIHLSTDQFNFFNNVPLSVKYYWSNAGNGGQTTGVVSFSRSASSAIKDLQQPIFSYCISFTNGYFHLGPMQPSGSLPSTSLVKGPYINYQHLYYVQLKQISIGDSPVIIPLTTVIIDTIISPMLLERVVYNDVKNSLVRKKGEPKNTNNELQLCYDIDESDWPDLKLFFPSSIAGYDDAQMVLTKKNYVIKYPNTNTECAAILPTQSLSVIGCMAQLDRQMTFNVQQYILQFSQYSGSTASDETGQSGLSSKTYPSGSGTYPRGYAVETKPGISLSLVVLFLFSCSWARWFRLT